MSGRPKFKIDLHSTVVVTDADWDELPLRRFNIVILVEPNMEWLWPSPQVERLAQTVWEDVIEELTNFADDRDDVAVRNDDLSPEVDIVMARIGSASFEIFEGAKEAAYVTFPQGMIQPYCDVLRHLGYWLTGVHKDHPRWTAVIIGASLENEIPRVANVAAEIGIATTILERYCIPEEFFMHRSDYAENPEVSYGEITADKVSSTRDE